MLRLRKGKSDAPQAVRESPLTSQNDPGPVPPLPRARRSRHLREADVVRRGDRHGRRPPPQAFGGGDEPDNLLIAHHGCNSARDTRAPGEVRLERSGSDSAPGSIEQLVAATAAGGAFGATFGAFIGGKADESGNFRPGGEAALLGALLGGLLGLALADG